MQRTTHQSEILFSQLTSQGGKGKFRSQFIIYGHLNWGLREQRSAVERQDTRQKGKGERRRAQAQNLSRNVAGISMLQNVVGWASACPGKLMDVQSFSGTKNKWFPSGRGAKSVSCHHVPRPEGQQKQQQQKTCHSKRQREGVVATLLCVWQLFYFHASFVKL